MPYYSANRYNKTKNNNGTPENNKIQRSRKELVDLCKQYGIRANISTRDMNDCVELVISGKKIPEKFRKKTWFEKNVTKILGTVTVSALLIAGVSAFIAFKRSR
ncbi:hypothetical protein QKU48_gp0155 [Fadolivirus algeromassiliense]|jgi:maltodextrin utilization protein YvdJ|uniref:Uncharacterized protein n=1 Tax=Fadolivirus FV1/VV64 TaxID=3070911 RepID=A0A7D3UQA3_9VIRU|nr:hypothetical protein QKU48_gp0155 [Fadolivirus algeromassiliense]QKF93613.1 hypothetical protein Fadolivirus_1_155 [Fadolivirus FV1/VV64]